MDRRVFLKAVGATALAGGPLTGCTSLAGRSNVLRDIPRLSLTTLPTACNAMPNLTELVGGPDLYVKRDDVMELAHGGNKTRKLEFSLAQAMERGARAVVTQGGLQSNHVRQTCSGAARIGLEAHVVLSNPVPEMRDALMGSGNYLMDRLLGARIYLAEDGRAPVVESVLAELEAAGQKPYNIPAGASDGTGSLGYVDAARELVEQWRAMRISPSHIFTATGSCGTHAGLLVGLRLFGHHSTRVIGVSVSGTAAQQRQRTRRVLDQICDRLGIDKDFIADDDVHVDDGYIGEGYGRPTEAGVAAMRTVAQREGIVLDPVYTGKCMAALLDMLGGGRIANARDVVFLHTGGAPAIHPYAEHLGV